MTDKARTTETNYWMAPRLYKQIHGWKGWMKFVMHRLTMEETSMVKLRNEDQSKTYHEQFVLYRADVWVPNTDYSGHIRGCFLSHDLFLHMICFYVWHICAQMFSLIMQFHTKACYFERDITGGKRRLTAAEKGTSLILCKQNVSIVQ